MARESSQGTCPRCHQEVTIAWKNPTKKDSREGWQIRVHEDDKTQDRCPISMMIVEDAEKWVRETRERLGLSPAQSVAA